MRWHSPLAVPSLGLIHHSDQGVQYASSEYVLRLERAGALISMAAVGNPYENTKVESFFRTLKMEEVYLKDYQDFEEAYENIAEFIEEGSTTRSDYTLESRVSAAGRIRGSTCPVKAGS